MNAILLEHDPTADTLIAEANYINPAAGDGEVHTSPA